jgi:hypothetical protein
MTDSDFRAWLDSEVKLKRMSAEQRDDLLEQKQRFDEELPAGNDARRNDYRGWIVGYVARERQQAREIHGLLERAKSQYPGRMIYFEPIGFDLF